MERTDNDQKFAWSSDWMPYTSWSLYSYRKRYNVSGLPTGASDSGRLSHRKTHLIILLLAPAVRVAIRHQCLVWAFETVKWAHLDQVKGDNRCSIASYHIIKMYCRRGEKRIREIHYEPSSIHSIIPQPMLVAYGKSWASAPDCLYPETNATEYYLDIAHNWWARDTCRLFVQFPHHLLPALADWHLSSRI